MIPNYLPAREYNSINNKHDILPSEYPDDWSMVIYYINARQAEIQINRLDEDCGWGHPIVVRIYDKNVQNYEDVHVGPSENNRLVKIINMSFIDLDKHIYQDQRIPKNIIQTNETNQYLSKMHQKSVQTIFDYNPEYNYYFFNAAGRRKFIKENFDSRTFEAYDKLYIKAMQADFFRYCVVYKLGGCYFDSKMMMKKPIRDIIQPDKDNVYCFDLGDKDMHNGIFFSIPGASNLHNFIQKIVDDIHYNRTNGNVFTFTGPTVFYNFCANQNTCLRLIQDPVYKKEELQYEKIIRGKCIFSYRRYKNYYQNHRKQDYHEMYTHKLIYYESKQVIDNMCYKRVPFVIGDTVVKDQFTYQKIDNKLHVTRKDSNHGWSMNLIVTVIDENTHERFTINVGPSANVTKIVDYHLIPENIISIKELNPVGPNQNNGNRQQQPANSQVIHLPSNSRFRRNR